MSTRSFGLATSTGVPAHPLAIETGRKFGVDLSQHRTTDLEDFEFKDGDLLLAMEIRQARRLASLTTGKDVQVSLLGLWSTPSRPHIHDPHTLAAEYFQTCFAAIKSGVDGLATQLRARR
jgi:protein-tyrosine phosphatase